MPETPNFEPYVARRTFDQKLLLRLRKLRLLGSLLRINSRFPSKPPLSKRLDAWRAGLLYRSHSIYDLERYDPRLFLRDHVDIDYFIERPERAAPGDKLTFLRLMQSVDLPTPQGLGYIDRGKVLPVTPGASADAAREPLEWLSQEPGLRRGFVLRPIDGFGGRGIRVFGAEIFDEASSEGETRKLEQLAQQIGGLDRYLATEFVHQHPDIAAFNPDSPNCVRLLTVWDLENHSPFIAAAVQRIGRPGRKALDGFDAGAGGLSVEIDLESGTLGAAVGRDNRDRRTTWTSHPETGARITGIAVPSWRRVLEVVERGARALPHSPFLGWDLLVDRRGEVQLLEANPGPGVIVWQVHRPLLADLRVRRFFESLGMA